MTKMSDGNCYMSYEDLELLKKLIIDVRETVVILTHLLEGAIKILTIKDSEL